MAKKLDTKLFLLLANTSGINTPCPVLELAQPNLKKLIKQCGSGIELIKRGFEEDIDLATELNVSNCIPTLVNKAYTHQ